MICKYARTATGDPTSSSQRRRGVIEIGEAGWECAHALISLMHKPLSHYFCILTMYPGYNVYTY